MSRHKPVNLDRFKKAQQIIQTGKDKDGNEYNTYGTMNQACWAGENVGVLLDEIDYLRQKMAHVFYSAKVIVDWNNGRSTSEANLNIAFEALEEELKSE